MAFDELKQVGRYIKKSNDDAQYALNRVHPTHHTIERVRDIINTSSPFQMNFKVRQNTVRTFIDLRFDKPPPLALADPNNKARCQMFTIAGNASHLLTVSNAYISGSVSVFMNSVILPSSKYVETNPAAGIVYVSGGPKATNIIVICFRY